MSVIENLPQEILLNIFAFLEPKDLVQCLQVSKSFRSIAADETLWQELRIQDEEIPVKLIAQVLNYGLNNLTIVYSDEYNQDAFEVAMAYYKMLMENNFEESRSHLKFPVSQLKSFDFADFMSPDSELDYEIVEQSKEFLSTLLESCYSLEKMWLVFSNFCLNFENFQSIAQNGHYLKVLLLDDNTEERWSLTKKEMKLIVDNCTKLSTLVLACYSDCDALTYLCKNLTPKIERLGIFSTECQLSENNIEILTSRYKNLTVLQIGGPFGLSSQGLSIIIKNLSDSLEKLQFEYHCGNKIRLKKFLEFQQMTKLTHLSLDGCNCKAELRDWRIFFEKYLPNVKVTFEKDESFVN